MWPGYGQAQLLWCWSKAWKRPMWSPDSRVRICLKCGHCSRGDLIFWFFYFRPPTFFFWQFFFQNWNLRPWFSLTDPILGIHSMGRGVWFLTGIHTNKTRDQIFLLWAVSHSRHMRTLESGYVEEVLWSRLHALGGVRCKTVSRGEEIVATRDNHMKRQFPAYANHVLTSYQASPWVLAHKSCAVGVHMLFTQACFPHKQILSTCCSLSPLPPSAMHNAHAHQWIYICFACIVKLAAHWIPASISGFFLQMMVLRTGDKCELILIFKEARVALAVGGSGLATSPWLALAPSSYVFSVHIA
jgi:hypothetical protein